MNFKSIMILGLALGLSSAQAAEYKIDTSHSSVGFTIKHLVISTVHGNFAKFDGTINFDENKPKDIKIVGNIDATTINTNNVKRDKHLKSKDFFDAEKYPNIVFKSTGVKKFKRGKGILMGEFTMHGVTKKINLDFEVVGTTADPYGNDKAVFSAKGEINRKDFGITWGDTLDNGGAVVGDEVKIILNIEANKVKTPAKKIADVKDAAKKEVKKAVKTVKTTVKK